MTQNRVSNSFDDEQTIELLRHHVDVRHGYALALAQKAGLSPEEAARMFAAPHLRNLASQSSATPEQVLEQQVRQVEGTLTFTRGEQHVQVERQAKSWLITATLPDREALERYGVSLEWHTQWLAAQLRLVCSSKGIACSAELKGETQYIQLSLQEA